MWCMSSSLSFSSSDNNNSKVRTRLSGTCTNTVGGRFGAGGGDIMQLGLTKLVVAADVENEGGDIKSMVVKSIIASCNSID